MCWVHSKKKELRYEDYTREGMFCVKEEGKKDDTGSKAATEPKENLPKPSSRSPFRGRLTGVYGTETQTIKTTSL